MSAPSFARKLDILGRDDGWLRVPARADVWLGVKLCLLVDLLFVVVYFGCNLLTARRAHLYPAFLPAELAIPLVPGMIWPYLSLIALFFLLFFCVRREQAHRVALSFAIATLVAGMLWLAFPARLGFERALPAGYEAAYAALFALDRPHNLVPSLHVAFSALTLFACAQKAPRAARAALWAWFCVILVSTILTHQHHLLDAATGLALASASRRLSLLRLGRLSTLGEWRHDQARNRFLPVAGRDNRVG